MASLDSSKVFFEDLHRLNYVVLCDAGEGIVEFRQCLGNINSFELLFNIPNFLFNFF